MRIESMVAAVSKPPLGFSWSVVTMPRHSSRTGAAVSAGVEITKEMRLPTRNDTGEANTTLSTPTLRVVPRTLPISIGIATSWHGQAWPSWCVRLVIWTREGCIIVDDRQSPQLIEGTRHL